MSRAVHLDEIPYRPDSCDLFEHIIDLPGAVLLDSCFPHSSRGRYDIMSACPVDRGLPLPPLHGTEVETVRFFAELGKYLRERYSGIQPAGHDIPFCGGILGYLQYDTGNSLHGVRHAGSDSQSTGADQLGDYSWCIIQDHLLRRSVLASQPDVLPAQRQDILARIRRSRVQRQQRFEMTGPVVSNFTESAYRSAFERIQSYIQAGDCYQVNLAQCFSGPCRGDPWQAYRGLRAVAAAPFSAYLAIAPDEAVLSLSPERFISLHGHHVETAPIKGTRPRHRDLRADQLAAQELRESVKDRAENLMIVDLLRNDLGRSCTPGSIHVDRLFEIQSFATVHHMVSTISGELCADCSAADLLGNSFPGGSITGAPKRRAMEIIAELEPDPRQVYCGSVLYISADGRMDSNIAIRTLLCRDNRIHCWAGGGIVADSRWQQEYQETYDKVGSLLTALETISLD